MDRVSSIRRMIEEGERADLFSPYVVSKKPWDLAARREAKAAGRATGAKFDPKSRFSDLKISVLDAVEQGDQVIIRWRLRGKWTSSFMGLRPSGREVDITGVNTYRFVGDKIVETDGEFDAPTFMLQARGPISAEECVRAMVEFSRPPEVEVSPIGTADARAASEAAATVKTKAES